MGSDIRKNKGCQNCGAFVEKEYCPNCGQKNTESRESFIHLFTHFISDFIHYKGSFWTTARYLMFKPGKLPFEYMNGRRKSYLNPFSLYIFISFLTFFIPSILPSDKSERHNDKSNINYSINDSTRVTVSLADNVLQMDTIEIEKHTIEEYNFSTRKVSELDSLQRALPDSMKMSLWQYNKHKYSIILNTAIGNGRTLNINEKGFDYAMQNFPKVLIFYMPIFAFWLWLFNCRKKRNYFDSGIFTLHFFSFWLFLICVFLIISHFTQLLNLDLLSFLLFMGVIAWISIYFFKAMRKFYGDAKWVTFIKGTLLVTINTFCILLVIAAFAIYVVFHFISYQ